MNRCVLLLLALTACEIHFDDEDDDPGRDIRTLEDIGLDDVIATGPPGALAFREDNDDIAWRAAGVANLKHRERPHLEDRWRIASVTKPFVATVVMQLVDERRLELDATVDRFVSGIPAGITLRDLLQHTSGLADYHDHDGLDSATAFAQRRFENPSARDGVQLALAHSPIAPPGTYHATDTDYRVLELVILAVTRRSVAAEVQARIIGPLGLADTTYPVDDAMIDGPYLSGYMPADLPGAPFGDLAHPIDYTIQTLAQTGAAGAMISSAADLSTFFAALLGGRLVSPRSLAEMKKTVAVDATSAERGITGAGLGLQRWDLGCGPIWGHAGATRGYTTLAFATADGRTRSVLVATMGPLPPAADAPALAAAARLVCDAGQ